MPGQLGSLLSTHFLPDGANYGPGLVMRAGAIFNAARVRNWTSFGTKLFLRGRFLKRGFKADPGMAQWKSTNDAECKEHCVKHSSTDT